jgi:[NiFe] hydrogenase assembly HybE family chaperone
MSDKAHLQIAGKLEAVFEQIYQQRMRDVPMVNDKLQVHAIDFQPWQQHYLGVLSTPWFMNLMLLPGDDEDWSALPELGKQSHVFPSGRYEFITGYEEEIGKYQMCSLFSPMFDFADDNAAVQTAHIIMREIMNQQNQDEAHVQSQQIAAIWKGETNDEVDATIADGRETDAETVQRPLISERLQQPVSRRELLRGMFKPDSEKT